MAVITDILQSLLGSGLRQADRLLRLHTALGADVLVAEAFEGWEALDGGGFLFELSALSSDAFLPLAKLVGTPVLLELLTADSRHDLRPFHGHVTAAERVGSNGGLARYRLVVEPWLALLRERQDSYAFHDLTVVEIVEQVFGHYAQGQVVPAWRWDLADRGIYLKRSLTTQYQESDFDFVSRLLAEEGIFYRFEHKGDTSSAGLGSHTLVLADSNESFLPQQARVIRFQRADATEGEDSIQQWHAVRRWQTGSVARASWDYRTLSMRPGNAQADGPAVDAEDDDTAGPYAWPTRAVGERRSRQHLDALHVCSLQGEGEGTDRRLAPGLRFALSGHAGVAEGEAFACLRVQHHARNNVGADVHGAVEQLLGSAFDAFAAAPPDKPGDRDEALYRNRFLALPIAQTYRPQTDDGHGRRLHPRPTASGAQTAIVVGNGDPIHTDRDHRIKVQFHWQRGGNAASRQEHPRGEANAPADTTAGTWVRVATPLAGSNWGSAFVPRVGQEVWVEFLEGDIDRPVVVGAVYNGQGNADAPHNAQAGGPSGSTGNAAAWFAGNGHAAVLSGIKTQDLSQSQSGSGGYRQLQFDDSKGQSRAQLYTTDRESALNLGHLKQATDNQRQADRGFGVELTTQAMGALRGGRGLLLSTADGANQMDASAPASDLAQSQQLVQGLADVAQKQQAGLDQEPAPDKLPATDALARLQDALAATHGGQPAGQGVGGGEGEAVGWSDPALVLHGKDGLASVTPQHHVWVAGTTATLSAGQDLNLTTQGKASVVAANGIALYAQGSEPPGSRPVKNTGIALHAASGTVSVQAQKDKAGFAAEQAVTLASTQAHALVQASKHVLLTAKGAYIRLQGGDIEIGAPGKVEFKAARKELTGPQSASAQASVPGSALKACPKKMAAGAARGASAI
ncbi:type IV secretion protein Rhs [Frateuria sp. Soil773]|uniref:type VI secretion system Vgr family protein n=1 Tax=Frateuria sp. Soil773 TaxID=1736407 RepID=UPI0006FAC19C|nr:type VI secretion system Vgr family protein [Frateuria sp. Soil773]KRE89286.1 type IV secretion protein Rhs [Frateuria sp. Soil773]